MVRVPTNRAPTHPGAMLQEEFLIPMGLTQRALADAIRVPYQRVNDLVNVRRSMTPSTALRLVKFFGNSAGFWMNLQLRWDLYFAQQEEQSVIKGIKPYNGQPPLAADSIPTVFYPQNTLTYGTPLEAQAVGFDLC